jgi:hypothetical protein
MIVASHRIVLRSSAVAVLATLALLVTGAAAGASDASISVGAPGAVAVGDTVEVKAILSLAGDPVEGAVVSLTYGTSFAGFDGRVELDRQTTGQDGVAVFTYEQRASDNGEMWVEYLGPDESALDSLVFSIEVKPGAEQQYRSEAGVSIPWLNGGWLVIAVIMLVWAAIVYVAFQLVIVGRTPVGDEPGDNVSAGLRSEDGAAAIAVLLATASVITAVGMVIVFVRNPVTHSNLDEPAGYNRTPIAHIDDEFSYPGPGLADPTIADSGDLLEDGRLTYFQYGCAGCHGLTGDGGAVAPALLGEVDSESRFAADVREGPENMPGYPEGLLSDEELARIYAFLSGEVTGD